MKKREESGRAFISMKMIEENAREGGYSEEFDDRYRAIVEEISTLKEEQAEARRKRKLAENYEQRVKDMDAFMESVTCQIPEFDNDLVRRLIENIKVISAEKLLIQFKSGIVMEQGIRSEYGIPETGRTNVLKNYLQRTNVLV